MKRRRRSGTRLLAERTLIEIKAKRLAFLREVGTLLSDALGFQVKVSLLKRNSDYTPAMRKAARMTKAQARKQMRDAFAPLEPREEPDG